MLHLLHESLEAANSALFRPRIQPTHGDFSSNVDEASNGLFNSIFHGFPDRFRCRLDDLRRGAPDEAVVVGEEETPTEFPEGGPGIDAGLAEHHGAPALNRCVPWNGFQPVRRLRCNAGKHPEESATDGDVPGRPS